MWFFVGGSGLTAFWIFITTGFFFSLSLVCAAASVIFFFRLQHAKRTVVNLFHYLCCDFFFGCVARAAERYVFKMKNSIELNLIYLHAIDWKMADDYAIDCEFEDISIHTHTKRQRQTKRKH